ncbi:MICOS complex subunit MIC60-1-like isoform X2 [Oscarella lobularis]|uniref:MICOS complex subunit MIC60-1-like isoform X2 n=1 Tax=Oscarella lobularis TaxID=121494 RepID=UPI003313BFC0
MFRLTRRVWPRTTAFLRKSPIRFLRRQEITRSRLRKAMPPHRPKGSQAGPKSSNVRQIVGGTGVALALATTGGVAWLKNRPDARKRVEERVPVLKPLLGALLGSSPKEERPQTPAPVPSVVSSGATSRDRNEAKGVMKSEKKAKEKSEKAKSSVDVNDPVKESKPKEEEKKSDFVSPAQPKEKEEEEEPISPSMPEEESSPPPLPISDKQTVKQDALEENSDVKRLYELSRELEEELSSKAADVTEATESLVALYTHKLGAVESGSTPQEIDKAIDRIEAIVATTTRDFQRSLKEAELHAECLSEAGEIQKAVEMKELMKRVEAKLDDDRTKMRQSEAEVRAAEDAAVTNVPASNEDKVETETAVDVDVVHEDPNEKATSENDFVDYDAHLAAALDIQRLADEIEWEGKIQEEKDRLERTHQKEIDQKVAKALADRDRLHQEELRQQLTVYHDHTTALLQSKEESLRSEFDIQLKMELQRERAENNTRLDSLSSRFQTVESAIDDVVRAKKINDAAREFYVACDALREAVETSSPTTPLKEYADAILRTCTNAALLHPLVLAVISSLPERAVNVGLVGEEALNRRFGRVKTRCRRVALVGENESAGMFTYLWSHVMSTLHLRRPVLDDAVYENPDTFDLLELAEHHLAKGDLDVAVRVVNQLKGEPRRVASDWLDDARALLETKQAISILLSFANVSGF